MKHPNKLSLILFISLILIFTNLIYAQRKMENLGRGLVAVRSNANQVFVSWRMSGTDQENITFKLYRDGNLVTATSATNFVDTISSNGNYYVCPVIDGQEQKASMSVGVQTQPYLGIPLQPIGDYYVHLAWVGDLDGDGEYDFVVDRNPNFEGVSAKLDAYRRDGTFLWRVDTGPNGINRDGIYPGSAAISNGHNDGITVYDLDNDGQAEVILKTANGVVFGDGTVLEDGDDDAQFISVLNGMTGAEEARAPVPQDYIAYGPVQGHFGIMYCDGVNPSFVFKAKNRRPDKAFNLMDIVYDYVNGELVQRWKWNRGSTNAPDFHQIRIIDIDGDGRDELCDGGHVIDDDGSFLYTIPGVVHGDRFHITDFDPDRPGLEGYCIQQDNSSGLAWVYYDAKDGSVIRQQILDEAVDLARGTAADIDPRYRGLEFWTFTDGIYTAQSDKPILSDYPWPNFKIWWDGDVLAELLNRERIDKWNYTSSTESRLLTASDYGAVDSWRDAAQFHGDIIGDWREEVIFENSDHSEIMIFTTTIPTQTRLYTLPHNPGYRACMTVKGYMQSNLVDYYLGDGMTTPSAPNITLVIGDSTSVDEIPPYRPQNLTANVVDDMIELAWNANNDADLAGYNIYRSGVSKQDYVKLNDDLLSGNSYQDTTIIYEKTYFYVVTAVDIDANESYFSNEIEVTPTKRPDAPTNLVAVGVPDSVKLSWNKSEETNVIGYNIYRSEIQGEAYLKINSDLIQETTYLDLNIQNSVTYFYVITCVNELQLESLYSAEVSATPGKKVVIEAEDGEYGGGVTNDSNHDGFFGTGFLNFPESGGYVEFKNISGGKKGGDYILRYRYALGNTARIGMLTVNGIRSLLTMDGTGDWENWQTGDVTISLAPGDTNVIRFQSRGQDLGNLDQIILFPADPTAVEASGEFASQVPTDYKLFQNYPNPFNPETVIRYTMPQAGFVQVRVVDILGRTVSKLVSQKQDAGQHQTVWRGKNDSGEPVSSGIYFYELVTNSHRSVKKMILVR